MWNTKRSLGLLTCVLVALPLACSPDSSEEGGSPELDVPRQVDSGFDFLDDAFVFQNYGGAEQGPQLTKNLVGRMFGAEQVCLNQALPCDLNPIAEGWMGAVNGTLNEGRSEGFAISSLLFHAGVLDPADFGGETVADLRLFGNRKLQEEIAYWAATQSVPSALTNDVRYQADEVMPFLAEALQPDSETQYRLAIAQRTDTGFARGHALTPIGYYKGEGDVYWLRIYDNNFPDKERRIEINPVANTWRYEIPSIDNDENIVYEGTPENGNFLYFSPVQDRLGVLKAPFASDSEVRTINYSSVSLVARRGEMETGLRDGEVLEAGEDRVTPAFSSCPRCGADVPIINQALIRQGIEEDRVIEIYGEGDVRTGQGVGTGFGNRFSKHPGDGDIDWISGTGPDYTTNIYPGGNVSQDTARFGEGGQTTYTSGSGHGVEIVSDTVKDGVFYSYAVEVEGSDDPATDVTVRITTDDDGVTAIEVENLPAGKEVTVEIGRRDLTSSDRNTETVTFASNGETSRATIDPSDDRIAVANADDISGGNCQNGVLDIGFETDVDCGGACNPCGNGKTCNVDGDCQGNLCVAEGEIDLCRSEQCVDGTKNGDETDVDCGGSACNACQALADQRITPQCLVATDCDTELCLDGRCRRKQSVLVVVNRLSPDGQTIHYKLDGVSSSFRMQADMVEGPHEFVLGEAYNYQVDDVGNCDTDFAVQTTGLSADDDEEVQGRIVVDCPEVTPYQLQARLFYAPGVPPVPDDDPLTLALTIDGQDAQFTMSGDPGRRDVAPYEDSWSAAVIRSPLTAIANPDDATEMGNYACHVAPWQSESGPANFWEAPVSCLWVPATTCSDGTRNQDESDIDCGGTICDACEVNKSCYDAFDCLSDICDNGICQAATCDDGVTNQDETDVDCGGSHCDACADGKACALSQDCASNNCLNNMCATPTCTDGFQNQDETGVDCGGVCTETCAVGDGCAIDSDCATNNCTNNICVASCSDGLQNQDETDVDCGGSACGACALGASCTVDSDCATSNCECAADSGNCTGNTGQCGVEKLIIDEPTTDGVTASGSMTVPAQCTEVYVQAWGAAGGSGGGGGGGGLPGGVGTPGGASGYVSGTLSVSAGDVIDVWVGQGGDFGLDSDFGGTPGIGSKYGVMTSGGLGDGDSFTGGGGSGGGLTSVEVSGGTSASFVIPAGGGATETAPGDDVAEGFGGGTSDSSGEDAPVGTGGAGGGAGEVGGAYIGLNGGAAAGTYGTYPAGFTTADGLDGVPANTGAPDYSLCEGIGQGAVGAGSNEVGSGFTAGGDGCVILRCVAP